MSDRWRRWGEILVEDEDTLTEGLRTQVELFSHLVVSNTKDQRPEEDSGQTESDPTGPVAEYITEALQVLGKRVKVVEYI